MGGFDGMPARRRAESPRRGARGPSKLGTRGPSKLGARGRSTLVCLALLVSLTACWADHHPPPPPSPWPIGPAPTWQWQLSGTLDPTVDADVFALDPFTTTADAAHRLRERDRRLICYVGAGAYEPSRPDASRFPAAVLGAGFGSPGRRWLDIRRWDVLEPILADRFRLCRGKGFDAVAPAYVDGYAHASGFPLGFDDQIRFNRRLAALAHSMSLSAGLTNDLPQVAALEPGFDFALNEECVRYRQCDKLLPFVNARKPVFHVEYTGATATFCVTTLGYGFASIRKDRALGVWRAPCLR